MASHTLSMYEKETHFQGTSKIMNKFSIRLKASWGYKVSGLEIGMRTFSHLIPGSRFDSLLMMIIPCSAEHGTVYS